MMRLRFPRKRGAAWVNDKSLAEDGVGSIFLCKVIAKANLLPSRVGGKGYVRLNVAGKTREQLEEIFEAARALARLGGIDLTNHTAGNTYYGTPTWRDIVQDELL